MEGAAHAHGKEGPQEREELSAAGKLEVAKNSKKVFKR